MFDYSYECLNCSIYKADTFKSFDCYSLCEKKSINKCEMNRILKIQKKSLSDLEKSLSKIDELFIHEILQKEPLCYFLLPKNLKKKQEIKKSVIKGLPRQWSPAIPSASKILINREFFDFYEDKSTIEQWLENLVPGKFQWVESEGTSQIKGSFYLRDSAVFLPNKTLLISFPVIYKQDLAFGFSAIPPSSIQLFDHLKKNKNIFGRGFGLKNVLQAISLAKQHNIPFTLKEIPIEGGNCFVFEVKGKRKAIIGIATLCAVVAKFLYDDLPIDEQVPSSLSWHALFFARNRQYLAHYLDEIQKIDHDDALKNQKIKERLMTYLENISKTIHEEVDEELFLESQVLLDTAKRKIADDLGVLPEDLSIVEQLIYHIDMEMCVNEKGQILIHNYLETIVFLNNFIQNEKPRGDLKGLVESYLEEAKKNYEKHKILCERRIDQLRLAGLEVISIPLNFTSEAHQSALNYCNAIIVKNKEDSDLPYAFITTGPSSLNKAEQQFHEYFARCFTATFTQYQFIAMQEISKKIAEDEGGMHCLSMNTL